MRISQGHVRVWKQYCAICSLHCACKCVADQTKPTNGICEGVSGISFHRRQKNLYVMYSMMYHSSHALLYFA